jgi:hypothetical protein
MGKQVILQVSFSTPVDTSKQNLGHNLPKRNSLTIAAQLLFGPVDGAGMAVNNANMRRILKAAIWYLFLFLN